MTHLSRVLCCPGIVLPCCLFMAGCGIGPRIIEQLRPSTQRETPAPPPAAVGLPAASPAPVEIHPPTTVASVTQMPAVAPQTLPIRPPSPPQTRAAPADVPVEFAPIRFQEIPPVRVEPLRIEPSTRPIAVRLDPLLITLDPSSPPIRVVVVENITAAADATTHPVAAQSAATRESHPFASESPGATASGSIHPSVDRADLGARGGWPQIIPLAIWILLAGAAGGVFNFLLFRDSCTKRSSRFLARDVALGIMAAFMVPILLSLVSSDLLAHAGERQPDLLILIGLCLIAAVFARGLLRPASAISRGVVPSPSPVDAARSLPALSRDEIAQTGALIAALVEANAELEPDVVAGEIDPRMLQVARALGDEEAEVLRALAKGPDRFRSEPGIAAKAEVERAQVQTVLARFEHEGYAGCVHSPRSGESLWYLTRNGRKLAAIRYIV